MDRQYTRLDSVRKILDPILHSIENEEDKRCAFVHLYGTGLLAATIALKRGYSREIAELAEIAGMLHDLLCYVDPKMDTPLHAHPCADYAKEMVLDKLDCFSSEEKTMLYNAIYNHSNKKEKGFYFDEILKDADLLHHSLRNPKEDFFFNNKRIQQVMDEILK